jgi:uncharacterized protein YoxC
MNPAFMYVVWTAIAVAATVSAVFLICVLVRLRPLIERLEGTAQFLEASRPKIDRILDGVEVELVELHNISEKANRIVGSAEIVTAGLRVAVQPIIGEISDLGQSIRHVRAAAVAARAGLSAWWGHRHVLEDKPLAEINHNERK